MTRGKCLLVEFILITKCSHKVFVIEVIRDSLCLREVLLGTIKECGIMTDFVFKCLCCCFVVGSTHGIIVIRLVINARYVL